LSVYHKQGRPKEGDLQLCNHERIAFYEGLADWEAILVKESLRKQHHQKDPVSQAWLYRSAFVGDECRTLVTGQSGMCCTVL